MNKCKYCLTIGNLTIDHKVPLINGGKDEPSNFQCLCQFCNGNKSDLDHGNVLRIARWINVVNQRRALAGKRPLGVRNKDLHETQETTP